MDCLSIADSVAYNCSKPWGVNCTNRAGFDFVTMWNITQRIQRYCPTDPRLFLNGNTAATPENAALTGQACKAIAGSTWQYYSASDIWVRLTTWKFPLFQLVASSPRPPLGPAVEGFVILHLMGDPIGTIKDLLRVISNCQQRADFWKEYLLPCRDDGPQLNLVQVGHAWKAFTIICISYDEWGKGNEVRDILRDTLESLLVGPGAHPRELENFLRLTNLTADALAADRATQFLPIIVAEAFFVGAIAVAIAKIIFTSPLPASLFINVEAHSIAFSALYFWILPAVFLTSIIGVSQTQNAVPRILRRLQTGFDLELRAPGDHPAPLPNDVLNNETTRRLNAGIYSWLPNTPDQQQQQQQKQSLRLKVYLPLRHNVLPVLLLVAGTATAMLVSGLVPPNSWQPRHCAQVGLLLVWLCSFALTGLLKRYAPASWPRYNETGRFWLTFAKDVLATAATVGGIVATQLGVFNRCDAYSRWDRVGLALPGMPDVAAVLEQRIGGAHPAIVFVSIALQMFVVPVVIAIWYRHALLVFLKRDDSDT